MSKYSIIGIDLAKKSFDIVAVNAEGNIVLKKKISRENFFKEYLDTFVEEETFAFEACSGSNHIAQKLSELGHKVILLKTKDVKAYAKSRQKNDSNDALAICKAARDPELMHVHPKTEEEQEVAYLHNARQNVIQQRIQRCNSIMAWCAEVGFVVACGKAQFATKCKKIVEEIFQKGYLRESVYQQMLLDCKEIENNLLREKVLDKEIVKLNKKSSAAKNLLTIPGIGPINASILSNKPMAMYKSGRDFAASLGLVPRQNTTGGKIQLGSITKQGDRYARTMLIQAARSLVMRFYKPNPADDMLNRFIARMVAKRKKFNVICVAIANKLARIAHSCVINKTCYHI